MRPAAARRLFELEPAPPERLDLQTSPRADTVASYVLTWAAERSWQILNQHLAARNGAVFWIGGPQGCGKTHFLNYVIALLSRAGAIEADNARRLICGFEVAGRVTPSELEFYLLSAIAEQIGAEQRTAALWREMRGLDALTVALENAHRLGVRALTVAIDFGLSESASAAEFMSVLAEIAAKSNQVRFTVIVAGRETIRAPMHTLEVAARDAREEIAVAVRRIRTLSEEAESLIERAYAGIETRGFAPPAIFPFHPLALQAIRSIAGPGATLCALSRIAREALETARESAERPERLVYPSDLTQSASIEKLVELKLAESGAAALKIAHAATAQFRGREKQLAREIIDALAFENLSGRAPITIPELESRVSMLADAGAAESWTLPMLRELLRQLEQHTAGIIRFDADAARFDPGAAGTPEIAAYNAALDLLQLFDSSLTTAHHTAELESRYRRIDEALGIAIEGANRTREALADALKESNLDSPETQLATIADFVALAEAGRAGLLKLSIDPVQRESARKVCVAYEMLAVAAEALPRMRAMRTYLGATGLRAILRDNTWQDAATVALETECELLTVELGPRLITGAMRNLNFVEARFQKFKWTYVQHYQAAHERWRIEMERLLPIADDARRYFDALTRLDAIAALGPAEGAQLKDRVAELAGGVVCCDLRDKLLPGTTPLCSSCGFQLGAHSPREELSDLMDRLRRALAVKLDALSQSVIARLIRQQDKQHRLEGFLKITQAAQTEALVRVLDENLAQYLALVLDENISGVSAEGQEPSILSSVKPTRIPRGKVSQRGKVTRMSGDRRSDR